MGILQERILERFAMTSSRKRQKYMERHTRTQRETHTERETKVHGETHTETCKIEKHTH